MKTVFWLVPMLLLTTSLACTKTNVPPSGPAPAPQPTATPIATPSTPKDGNYTGRGKVTKINMDLGSVEIDHEDIPDMMPAMKMEFFVKDKSILKNAAVGDSVEFVVEYKDYHETILSIKKI